MAEYWLKGLSAGPAGAESLSQGKDSKVGNGEVAKSNVSTQELK